MTDEKDPPEQRCDNPECDDACKLLHGPEPELDKGPADPVDLIWHDERNVPITTHDTMTEHEIELVLETARRQPGCPVVGCFACRNNAERSNAVAKAVTILRQAGLVIANTRSEHDVDESSIEIV